MGFRHVVMFRFTDEATADQRKALAAGLDSMPAATGAIEADRYRHGPDVGIGEGNWDYVIVADFATAEQYLAYRDHPDHQALIRDLVRPILAERAAVQLEVAD
jgi:Stress responsive A/B Barrel Domain